MQNQIYFIDSKLNDYQAIINSLSSTDLYYLIDSTKDGLTQISNTLLNYSNLDSIHIYSHGDIGSLNIGNTIYDNTNISNYKIELENIGKSLSSTGDILLYGCNVGQDELGLNFINQIAQFTQADVASSNDLTGNRVLGGDWDLEVRSGIVETNVVGVEEYQGVLNYESESNNTLATATSATLGTLISGQLASTSDVDYYKYSVTEAGSFAFTFDAPINSSISSYFNISVYNSSGTLLSSQKTGTDFIFNSAALSAGDYYVAVTVVDSYYYSSGQYSLTTAFTAGNQSSYESESNNTLATATSATLGTLISGQLASTSDVDYYKYSVTEAGSFAFTFDAPINSSISSYFNISVYNSSGTLLSSQKTGTDFIFNSAALSAGDYYVAVTVVDSYYYSSGQYSLTTAFTAGNQSSYESESNNTLATATSATLGTLISGQLASTSDVDYYKYSVTEAGSFAFTFDAPINSSISSYFNISVYNSSGTLLSSQKTGTDFIFNSAALSAGDYYVAVTVVDSYYYSSGQYSLTTAFTAGNQSSYESESNNTLATATSATLGTLISGQLASTSDVDYYKYSVTEAGSFAFTFDAPINSSISSYFNISVYNSSGTLLSSQKTGTDFIFNSAALSAGDYYVAVTVVDSYYYSSGQYSLTTAFGNAPEISSASSSNLNENSDVNTVIYRVIATDSDSTSISYSISGIDASLLNINSSTGEITLKLAANYEYKNSYSFNVIAYDGLFSSSKSIIVNINNVNETPIITSSTTGTIAENSALSTVIYKTTATDADANTTLTYSLSGTDANLLNIDSSTGEVTLKTSADYETKNSYSFNVIASDGSLTTTKEVIVNVSNVIVGDSNDSSKVLTLGKTSDNSIDVLGESDYFRVDLTAGNRYLFQMNAEGLNSIYHPSLSLYSTDMTFIKSDYALYEPLKNMAQISYIPTVSGTYYLRASELGDDNVGKYTINASLDDYVINSSTATSLSFGNKINSEITAIGEKDYYKLDLTANTRYMIELDSTSIGALNTGYLILYNPLTYELIDYSYNDNLTQISFKPTSSGTYYLQVSEMNDDEIGNYSLKVSTVLNDTTAPTLTSLIIPSNIDISKGNSVLGISATATDDLSGIDDMVIWFDNNLSYSGTADSTTFNSFKLIGLFGIYDSWTDGRAIETKNISSSNANGTYNITKVDLTDNTNNKITYTNSQLKAMGINTSFEITGGTKDLPEMQITSSMENGKIVLSISTNTWTSSTNTLNFVLNYDSSIGQYETYKSGGSGAYSVSSYISQVGSSGKLTFNSSISNYGDNTDIVKLVFNPLKTNTNFTYNISSGSINSLNLGISEGQYKIPSAPTITSISTGTIAENSALSTVIYKTTATDADANTTLKYSLSGIDSSLLNINSSTGAVTLKSSANYEAKKSYSFNVIASDGSLSSSKAVIVNVSNVNEFRPTITSISTGTIAENSALSTVIYKTTATDADANTTLKYSLSGIDSSLLNINSSTGAVTLKSSANYEAKKSYSFNVIASDGSLSSSKAVIVNVSNVNEFRPTSVNKTITMNEDSKRVLTLTDFAFSDADVNSSLSKVKITQLETKGRLTLNGIDVTLNKEILASDIKAGKLVYASNANEFGTSYANFKFQVSDGSLYSTNSYTTTFNVTNVADARSSSVSYTLSEPDYILTLTGTANINGTGNNLNNTITGNTAANILNGKSGNDTLYGGAGNDTLYGELGNDILNGQTGNDTMLGGAGNDIYYVDSALDKVYETKTTSSISGDATGIDTVNSSIGYTLGLYLENLTLTRTANINGIGNNLNNTIIGNTAANILNGKSGNDTLYGGAGNDTLYGELGNDILYGGLNKDTFVFNTTLNATTNKDIIKDFSVADDTISLENAIFKKLTTTGLLNTAYFKTTTDGKATDSNDYIVYNKTNGQLLYDADGNGAGASVLFAVVENKVALTNADFFVI